MKKFAFLLVILTAALVWAQLPLHSRQDVDFTKGRQQFDLKLRKGSTLSVPFYFHNGTQAVEVVGWTGVLQWAENSSSTNLGQAGYRLTGVVDLSSCTFTPATNTFTSTFDKWYCRIVLTSNQASISDIDGWITVEN